MNLPRYRSHKVVEAFKIAAVTRHYKMPAPKPALGGESAEENIPAPEVPRPVGPPELTGATLFPEAYGTVPVTVDVTYLRRHDPQVGGYYVRYPDGYESWSPAEVFESGYTRLIG